MMHKARGLAHILARAHTPSKEAELSVTTPQRLSLSGLGVFLEVKMELPLERRLSRVSSLPLLRCSVLWNWA